MYNNHFHNKPIIVITGPTAIGKTDLSLRLCEYFDGEVINADASQFKKELNIGTAKIDLNNVKIKHYLIDIIGPMENYSISDYQKEARLLIEKISSEGKMPFVIGGSGLYINALMYDYQFNAPGRDDSLYDSFSNEDLHNKLMILDYEASLNIPVSNRKRLIRAIELAKAGHKISENICELKPIYNSIFICLTCDRELLYQRINKRVDVMFTNGWIDECISLKNKGYDLDKIGDIGYKEINDYLNGLITFEDAKEVIKKRTRNYAKRQMTWFRNKMNCIFVTMDYNNIDSTFKEVVNIINNYSNQ